MEGPVPHIEVEERGGVPVFWTELPGSVRGSLMFRVGRADEVLARLGATHLVEHLAMFPIGRPLFQANAMVDDTRTIFFADGTVEEVSGFLGGICRALADLPLDRLDVERRILQTEAAGVQSDFFSRLMSYRYGAAGHGLGTYKELGLGWLDADDLTRWSRERFTAGNAAVWMTAPPPPDLAIELPPGEPIRPPKPVPRPGLRHPVCVIEGTGGVAATFVARRSLGLTAAGGIASERIHGRLRLEQGLSYNVDGGYVPLDAELAHVVLGADCIDENAVPVWQGMQAIVDEIAADGPGPEELERYVTGYQRAMRDPDWAPGALDGMATDHLFGRQRDQPQKLFDQLGELAAADVAGAMREAVETEILLLPQGTEPPGERFQAIGDDTVPVEGRTFRVRRRGLRRPKTSIVVGETGISLLGAEGGPITVPFADCVAVVERKPGEFEVLGRDESFIAFDVASLEAGAELEAALRSRVSAELFVPPEADPTTLSEA